MKKITLSAIFGAVALHLLVAAAAFAQKLTPVEIVAKHLDSIGTKDKRAAVKNQLVMADLEFRAKGSAVPAAGKALMLSEGEKNLWGMNLNSNDYPLDRFVYDGRETEVGFTRPGQRSALGGFLLSYREILREGLLGGTLLGSWALLHTDTKTPKLATDGTKKIDGRETLVLSYLPRKGSDLNIRLFFDAANFRHVRTEYTRVIDARQGSGVDSSAGMRPLYYRLTEEFANFQNVNGLQIPKTYKIQYSNTGTASTPARELEWTMTVTNFSLNQQLEANSFAIETE